MAEDPRPLVELLALGPFGGLDATTAPYYVAEQNFVDTTNFVPNANYGGFSSVLGRIDALLDVLPSVPNGIHLFARQGLPDVYLFAVDDLDSDGSLVGHLYYAQIGGTPRKLKLPSPKHLTAGQPTSFADQQRWVFLSNGVDTPLKIDENLVVTYWGIVKPDTAPTATNIGPGVLLGTYYYCTTFGNAHQESSQGTITDPLTFTNSPAKGSVVLSTNPKAGETLYFTAGQIGGDQFTAAFTIPAGDYDISANGAAFAEAISTNVLVSQFVFASAAPAATDGTVTITLTAAQNGAAGNLTFFFCDVSPGATAQLSPTVQTELSGGTDGGTAGLSAFPTTTDTQVTELNIYRLGGSLGTWNLITTRDIGDQTPFVDSTPDSSVTGQQLTIFRDPPPPFKYLANHMERVWGFSTPDDPSLTGWSNYNEPYAFNLDTNTRTAGDNMFGDVGKGMMELGGVLGLIKSGRVYWVYGTTDSDFTVIFAFFIGCDSPGSIATGYGMGFVRNRQGIYILDGNSYQNISDGSFKQSNVKRILDALTTDDDALAVGFIYDRGYYFSVPTQGFTLLYDMRTQTWWKLGFSTPAVCFNLDAGVPVLAADDKQVGQIDQWFASENDLGNPITSSITSRISDGGASQAIKQLRYGIIQAPVQAAVVSVVTMCDPSTEQQLSDSIDIDLSDGRNTHRWSMAIPEATEIQILASVTSMFRVLLDKISVYGWVKRLFEPTELVAVASSVTPRPPPSSNIRVTQEVIEVLGSEISAGSTIRVTQEVVQVLGSEVIGELRVTQEVVEVLGTEQSDIRVTQEVVEVLGVELSTIQVTQDVIEVIGSE